MAAIELFKMYTNAIDFGRSAKSKMAAIMILKRCSVHGVNMTSQLGQLLH